MAQTHHFLSQIKITLFFLFDGFKAVDIKNIALVLTKSTVVYVKGREHLSCLRADVAQNNKVYFLYNSFFQDRLLHLCSICTTTEGTIMCVGTYSLYTPDWGELL